MNHTDMKRMNFPFTAIVGQEDMKRALLLNLINPQIGGVLIRGEKGTANRRLSDHWLMSWACGLRLRVVRFHVIRINRHTGVVSVAKEKIIRPFQDGCGSSTCPSALRKIDWLAVST